MHSPNTRDFESLRSALWLCVDLFDDWIDAAPRGSHLKITLQDVRWALMDQLSVVRRLEADAELGEFRERQAIKQKPA